MFTWLLFSALRSDDLIYFVGGLHSKVFPTVYKDIGGSTFYYHHPLYDTGRKEFIESLGPTNQTLYLSVSLVHTH